MQCDIGMKGCYIVRIRHVLVSMSYLVLAGVVGAGVADDDDHCLNGDYYLSCASFDSFCNLVQVWLMP